MKRHESAQVPPTTTLAEAIRLMEQVGIGILLICSESGELLGVLTDGDLRRAIMARKSLSDVCLDFANIHPLVVTEKLDPDKIIDLMDRGGKSKINQIPVLDNTRRVIDLLLRDDFRKNDQPLTTALVMAGGFGTRLYPLTKNLPKPMLKVAGYPVIEHLLKLLQTARIQKVYLSTHFHSEKIKNYFEDGEAFGLSIHYLEETQPLGTAGAIGLLPQGDETIFVINGDILTDINVSAFYDYHKKHNADMTIAVRKYETKVPYGVVECDGHRISAIVEKPTNSVFVNAGVYLLERGARSFIPRNQAVSMTDFITKLLETGRELVAFPIIEYWLDIGQPADYQRAKDDFRSRRLYGT